MWWKQNVVFSVLLMVLFLLSLRSLGAKSEGPLAIGLRQVSTGERVFVDSDGRQRFFHGVNAVVKGPPWIPQPDSFDPLTSLAPYDFELLSRLGLNMVRLGVMWPGLQPDSPAAFSEHYLRQVDLILRQAAVAGVYVLLDMHQDVLAERFCGEGIPLWAANATRSPPGKDSAFPMPVGRPLEAADYDNATGYALPTRQACNRYSWGDLYFSEAASLAFQDLYTNEQNLTVQWGRALGEVAARFAGRPEVLGIELINEPWAGDIYQQPELLVPGVADRRTLQPAYQVVAQQIRQRNDDILLFFEGTTWSDAGFGFNEVPGGPLYANRSVVAFHYYVPPQLPNSEEFDFTVHIENARNMQCGYMLTEFGGLYDPALFVNITRAADDHLLSWSVWEWKDYCKESNETLNSPSQWAAFGACKTGYGGVDWVQNPQNNSWAPSEVNQKSLARAYPMAVAGTVLSMSFDLDPVSLTPGPFTLVFTIDLSCELPTEIYLSQQWFFSSFTVNISPAAALKVSHLSNSNILTLIPTFDASQGAQITVKITPN